MEVERIRSGDPEALGLLLRETWAPLVAYLHTLLDSVEAAEDAAQEAFVRLWEHRERWESGSARAVLFRIARNAALDQRRRAEVRRRWGRGHRRGPAHSPPTPEEEFSGTEFLARFHEALQGLPPRRREVFELIRFRGLSHRDVAEVLEVSERTVANHFRLAMMDLRHRLTDVPQEEPAELLAEELHLREERSSDG